MNYKGMDKDMKCRGFQYEVGKEYEEEKAELCNAGFHACEYPLSVFDYYPPNSSRYFEVEQSGDVKTEGDKTVSTKIKIKTEIGIPGLVKAAIEYTKSRCNPVKSHHTTGNWGAASATGDWGAASATGNQGAASATGDQGAASATGYQGAASATGYQGAAFATGDQGAAISTGKEGSASVSENADLAVACGFLGKAKAPIGKAICVMERGEWNGKTYPIKSIKAAIVDGVILKGDTYYTLKDGEFVEA